MKPLRVPLVLIVLAVAAGCATGGGRPAPVMTSSGALKTVTLSVGNRMYPNFTDTVTVAVGEVFPIGDTEFTARIDRFFPDFVIDNNRTFTTRSLDPKNPAAHVQVLQKKKVIEESWAFGTQGPPHMSADKFMYFVIQKLDFEKAGVGHDDGRSGDAAHPGGADSTRGAPATSVGGSDAGVHP